MNKFLLLLQKEENRVNRQKALVLILFIED